MRPSARLLELRRRIETGAPLEKLQKAHETVKKMLSDRGWDVSEAPAFGDVAAAQDGSEAETEGSRAAAIRAELETCVLRAEGADKLSVFWISGNLGNSNAGYLYNKMVDAGTRQALVVVAGKVTAYATAALECMETLGFEIELFSEDELQRDPTQSVHVPQMSLLSPDEKARVLRLYATEEEKARDDTHAMEARLQKILETDPVARHFGAKRGDVFKVQRKAETSVQGSVALAYRVVV